MTTRFNAVKAINSLFSVLWIFPDLKEEEIREKTKKPQQNYEHDISQNICDQLIHLQSI
jgi:hypothetical protein